MNYAENLIDAYKKLDAAVGIFVEKGGTPDDRPQLAVELDWRLRELSTPPKESVVGGVKIWSDGRWYGNGYCSTLDNRGYTHIVTVGTDMRPDNYYDALHLWVRNAFLRDSSMSVTHICGQNRNIIHHINEDKQDNNVANLILIPKSLHRIYHPSNTAMLASDVALEFIARYGDNKSLTATAAEKPPEMVDARWLHGALGVKKKFADWIEQWGDKVPISPVGEAPLVGGFPPQGGFSLGGEKPNSGGRPCKDYTLTVEDALMVAMRTDTTAAEAVRRDLINKLKTAQRPGRRGRQA
jgi:hypothetical protein